MLYGDIARPLPTNCRAVKCLSYPLHYIKRGNTQGFTLPGFITFLNIFSAFLVVRTVAITKMFRKLM